MASVRHRRLARMLRQARESRGLKPADVANDLGWDPSKISRLETAKVARPKPTDVADLLDLYGVTSPERDALIQLAKDARRRNWWAAFGGVFDGTYVGLEDEAATIFSWQTQRIPGLLQTEDYARAVLSAVVLDRDRIDEHVRARMARRPLLRRNDHPPCFHAVIDEAVLHRTVGGLETMRAQLSELWASAQRPNITIQILPFDAGAHAGMDGAFVILGFADEGDPDVVYVEGPAGDLYPESTEQITRFRLTEQRLKEAALSPEASASYLADLTRE